MFINLNNIKKKIKKIQLKIRKIYPIMCWILKICDFTDRCDDLIVVD